MFFAVISILPEMFSALTEFGITGRAIANHQAEILLINPRDFTIDKYRRVDERPFGGGAGMVMMAEPLAKAIEYAKDQAQHCYMKKGKQGKVNCPVVFLSPQGKALGEQSVLEFCQYDGLILLCGRYDGIDERLIEQYVEMEVSIGDYVLTGGELPAMVLMDSIIRRLPHVMGDENSALQDSFVDGLLDYPQYTKPLSFGGRDVPEVLLSGHHANIAKWRFVEQVRRTQSRRPDLWQAFVPDKQQQKWLKDTNI